MVVKSLFGLALLLTTCQDAFAPVGAMPNAIGLVTENYDYRTLHMGDTVTVHAFRLDRRGMPIIPDTVKFWWTSSDTTVLKVVDTTGLTTVVGLGEARVIAHFRDINVAMPSPYDTTSGSLKLVGMYTVIDPGPVRAAAVSYEHQCVVRNTGQAYCRGRNEYGQLGDGTTEPYGPLMDTLRWRAVSGGLSFVSISAGSYHTCGLTADQRAFCWGRAHHGQLGNGQRRTQFIAVPTEIIGDRRWLQLDAGGHGATCGITLPDRIPYCFGHNDAGQTGRAPINSSDTAVAPIDGSHHMSMILTEHFYTCGLETDGSVYCSGFWGPSTNTPNNFSTFGTTVPTRIGGTQVLTSISIAGDYGCGLDAQGAAYCWGWGSNGNLGTGDFSSSGTMRPVTGGHSFRSINAWESTSCGITHSGEAWCWGYIGLGRVQSAAPLISAVPTLFRIPTKLKSLLNGDETPPYTCAITEAEEFICWGRGY